MAALIDIFWLVYDNVRVWEREYFRSRDPREQLLFHRAVFDAVRVRDGRLARERLLEDMRGVQENVQHWMQSSESWRSVRPHPVNEAPRLVNA